MARFRLRFPQKDIAHWAQRYAYAQDDQVLRIGRRVQRRRHITKDEFLALCRWKTPRSQARCARNDPRLIEEASSVAFRARHDHLKIGALLVLDGVSWPTASVILHLCDRGPHPILDYRALWSLGFARPPSYNFDFWSAYARFVRGIASETRHSMRIIDQALWQYAKEHQRGLDT